MTVFVEGGFSPILSFIRELNNPTAWQNNQTEEEKKARYNQWEIDLRSLNKPNGEQPNPASLADRVVVAEVPSPTENHVVLSNSSVSSSSVLPLEGAVGKKRSRQEDSSEAPEPKELRRSDRLKEKQLKDSAEESSKNVG